MHCAKELKKRHTGIDRSELPAGEIPDSDPAKDRIQCKRNGRCRIHDINQSG